MKIKFYNGLLLTAALIFCLPSEEKAQQTYTFTAATATGNTGPTQGMINTAYNSTNLNGLVQVTGGIQSWTVPYTGGFRITAVGASGGSIGTYTGGLGASMTGDFTLTAGTVLRILVGQAGQDGLINYNNDMQQSGGTGGGGSYVVTAANAPLVVAGGGGGSSMSGNGGGWNAFGQSAVTGSNGLPGGGAPTSGGTGGGGGLTYNWTGWHGGTGGGGFTGNGINNSAGSATYGTVNGPGIAYLNGGGGGVPGSMGRPGGFGGGGSAGFTGGGGGGYSGGGAGSTSGTPGGGGGGSYNAGINQNNIAGVNTGHGRVLIQELCNLQITSSGSNSLNPSICSGQSVTLTTNAASNYTWSNGNSSNLSIVVSPTTTTTYSVIGTSSLNCVAGANIVVTVSNGLPVLSISNPSNNVCSGRSVTLTASGALSYTWSSGVINGQPFTPTTTSSYTVTGQNGCGTVAAVANITVAPLQISIVANPALICQGSTSTLTAVSSVTGYTWQPGSITGNNPIVGPMSATIYTVTASDGTCTNTQTVAVNTKQTPTIALTPTFVSICQNESVTITASGAGTGGTYSWTPGNATGSSLVAAPATSTVYTATGTNTLGCTSSAQMAVLVGQPLPLNVSSNKQVVCTGGQAVLTAGGSNSYTWTNGPATANFTVNPQAPASIYTVTGGNTSNTCTATRTIAVAVLTPSVAYTSSASVCAGQGVTLTASGANTYTWNGINQNTNGVYTYTPSQSGNVVLIANTVSLATTCTSSMTAQVVVNQNPTITVAASKTTTICKGVTVTLTAGGAQTYTWSNSATTGSVAVSPSVTTTYSVLGRDVNNCESSQQYIVNVSKCAGLEAQDKDELLQIYPNPNNGIFTVHSSMPLNLVLTNELGQQIRSIQLNHENRLQVDVRDLPAGLYFVSGQVEGQAFHWRIVVSK